MKHIQNILISVVLFSITLPCLAQNKTRDTYVLVHGAWGGGWAFKEVDSILTSKGNTLYRPTLTGQGEKAHLASPNIGLDTHITDIVNTILFEKLENIILVGHSYGGMIITGVADQIPEKIKHLIYLDAIVPKHNESFASIYGDPDKHRLKVVNGGIVPPWVKEGTLPPKDVPHPIKTWSDTIQLHNPNREKVPTSYIFTVDKGHNAEEDTFFSQAERARNKKWPVITIEGDHNMQWSNPKSLTNTILKIVHPQLIIK